MSSNTVTYVTQEKKLINTKELSRLFNLAKGYRNTNQFLNDLETYTDKEIIIDILNGRYNSTLRVHHLRKVAQASEYRVTIDQLANAAGIILNDNVNDLKKVKVVRGGIYQCDFGNVMDSEQGGIRPALVLQNQLGNDKSTLTIVAPITTAISKNKLPTHVSIGFESGLVKQSEVLLEQITRVFKNRLLFKGEYQLIGETPNYLMKKIDSAIKKSMGLIPLFFDENMAKEYLKAMQGIEDARKFRNTIGLQIAHNIIMDKLEEYCSDYNVNSNIILNKYNEFIEKKRVQRSGIYDESMPNCAKKVLSTV